MPSLFHTHIEHLVRTYEAALNHVADSTNPIEGVLIHSGSEDHYFADDRGIPFQAYGHFCHWLPVNRPEQFVYFRPGNKPVYFQVVPSDFWYDQSIELESSWGELFEIIRLTSRAQLSQHLEKGRICYIGPQQGFPEELGFAKDLINPTTLLSYLDFQRATKSSYEVKQLKVANRIALQGHQAAREAFLDGGSEYAIHMAYLSACNILEEESPYTNIVALDEKSAILHYQHKRRDSGEQSKVLLIDAGVRVNAYGSDITRTSAKTDAHPVFKSLIGAMEKLELELVAAVRPGDAYGDIHQAALAGVAEILAGHELCAGTADELLERQIPQLFMPHGVGHLLGIQVHDVGGHQSDINGASLPPPLHSPALRNTRTMSENMVFTIEPGLYFIPMILDAERGSAKGEAINFSLVEELYPLGGIRIEDNIRVTATQAENLTRQFE